MGKRPLDADKNQESVGLASDASCGRSSELQPGAYFNARKILRV